MWGFRSTRQRVEELRKQQAVADAAAQVAKWANEQPPVRVSADFSEHHVRVDVDGLGFFTLSAKTAFAFAKQVEGAADALGPEPAKRDESVDITADVEKESGDG